MKRQLAVMLFPLLAAHVCIADCLYGDCERGLGIQTTEKSFFSINAKETYVGDFTDGKKTGCGTFETFGSIYFGQVKDSKRDGLGTLLDLNSGKVKEGRWKNNRFKESMTIDLDGLCPQVQP